MALETWGICFTFISFEGQPAMLMASQISAASISVRSCWKILQNQKKSLAIKNFESIFAQSGILRALTWSSTRCHVQASSRSRRHWGDSLGNVWIKQEGEKIEDYIILDQIIILVSKLEVPLTIFSVIFWEFAPSSSVDFAFTQGHIVFRIHAAMLRQEKSQEKKTCNRCSRVMGTVTKHCGVWCSSLDPHKRNNRENELVMYVSENPSPNPFAKIGIPTAACASTAAKNDLK